MGRKRLIEAFAVFLFSTFAGAIAISAESDQVSLCCSMSDGSTVYFIRYFDSPAILKRNFEFYHSDGRITDNFRGYESDGAYRYSWGSLQFGSSKFDYSYEIDRFSLEISATFEDSFQSGVTRLTGKCSSADYNRTVATVRELKSKHERDAAERERALRQKEYLEKQERIARRKI